MTCVAETTSFAPARALWDSLLPRAAWRSVFLAPEWQEAWWDEFGGEGELRLIAVGPPDAPLGLAPLRLRAGDLSFLGDSDLFDYHDFIAADPAFYPALFDCLEREDWRTMTLESVPEESPTLRLLPEAAVARGYGVEIEEEDVAPGVALPASWDDTSPRSARKTGTNCAANCVGSRRRERSACASPSPRRSISTSPFSTK